MLNAGWRHRTVHHPSPRLRCSCSLCSTPDGVIERFTRSTEIHQREVEMCSTPDGVIERFTTIISVYGCFAAMCSTPDGVIERFTASDHLQIERGLMVLNAGWRHRTVHQLTERRVLALNLCSTPDGVIERFTSSERPARRPSRCAQRRMAS